MKNDQYIPCPIDLSDVELPADLEALTELIARNVHEVWAQKKLQQGWSYGEAIDEDLKAVITGTLDKVQAKMADLKVADALTEIFAIFKRCNKYIDETEPWVLAKDEAKADRLATVMYNLVEGITIGASLLAPFMPATAEKIVAQLNTQIRGFDELNTFEKETLFKVCNAMGVFDNDEATRTKDGTQIGHRKGKKK